MKVVNMLGRRRLLANREIFRHIAAPVCDLPTTEAAAADIAGLDNTMEVGITGNEDRAITLEAAITQQGQCPTILMTHPRGLTTAGTILLLLVGAIRIGIIIPVGTISHHLRIVKRLFSMWPPQSLLHHPKLRSH